MTQYIYIASPLKLPQGEFGLNPVSKDKPNVFRTDLDFVHLYFENNYDEDTKQKFSYSKHFSYKHQTAAYTNSIPLKHEVDGSAGEKKCLELLYSYLENAIYKSGAIEYFTSISGEEDLSISKKKEVKWADIKTPYDLVLEDREFWGITL